jgi:putative DNA primase/helicase
MSPLDAALRYARTGWPVFPCRPIEPGWKRPLTYHAFYDASTELATIRAWWWRWPDALIGVRTGIAIGAVVLDIDVKFDDANGYDALEALGVAILPETPMVVTATGGLHLYFSAPAKVLRNTGGARGRGIGPGLDWRGEGGYVIAPSPRSGYEWDPHWNLDTVPLGEVPLALLPREREQRALAKPARPENGVEPLRGERSRRRVPKDSIRTRWRARSHDQWRVLRAGHPGGSGRHPG